jgi:hypothetical protein
MVLQVERWSVRQEGRGGAAPVAWAVSERELKAASALPEDSMKASRLQAFFTLSG